MYVVTFYSFKGGVGRTLALVNVGVSLVQSGKRVLLVDFDLEAPGLDTFKALRPPRHTPGILEYIHTYLDTDGSPDVTKYMYSVPTIGKDGGGLWIMPSGKPDGAYGAALSSINWGDLYANRNGYLLFEDLRAQWEATLRPDYVLIDSRTGHTDVGGICTRQLPDAVVALFVPNDQNLRGLTKVISDIRSEADAPRQKPITIHFVMSNVADLDDEDLILAGQVRRFEAALGSTDHTVIHHYPSLALLSQTIFTLDRPRSRLAQEYNRLTDRITEANLADRTGALRLLRNVLRHRLRIRHRAPTELDEQLDKIAAIHDHDPEILFRLAEVRKEQGRLEDALRIVDRSIETGASSPAAFLLRAECRQLSGDRDGATQDIGRFLDSDAATAPDVNRALGLLAKLEPSALATVGTSKAVLALSPSERRWIIAPLGRTRSGMHARTDILKGVLDDNTLPERERDSAVVELVLSLISIGRFQQAIEALGGPNIDPESLHIADAFNLAMAEWGSSGVPSRSLFARVRSAYEDGSRDKTSANLMQCMALTSWIVSDHGTANAFLDAARQAISRHAGPEFSCWRYLYLTRQEFLADLDAMDRMINGESLIPEAIAQPDQTQKHR